MNSTTHKIHPNKEYSAREIRNYKLFPWATHYKTITQLIKKDIANRNELETRIEGAGYCTRYHIKGSNIQKYINKYSHILSVRVRKNIKSDDSTTKQSDQG